MNTAKSRPRIVAPNRLPSPVSAKVPLSAVMLVNRVPPVAETRAVRINAPKNMFIYFLGSMLITLVYTY